MRAGDAILLGLIAAGAGLTAADAASGGAVWSAARATLPGFSQTIGAALGWLGLALSPFLLIPLIAALWGRFFGLPRPASAVLANLADGIDAVSRAIGDAARWFALGLVLITALVVVQRYVFGVSVTKLQESVIYLHALLFLLSTAATLLADGHVRVDVIYSKLSERAKAWTDLLGVYLALIPMCWLIMWASSGYVGAAWRIMERSRESDGLPFVFLLKTAIPVFAILLIAQGLSLAIRAALTLSGRAQARPVPAGPEAV
ncbi:TRAP transporter small permease subunit [Glycocaulis profundi]|nr:TRAP transporter small permease subunit [Glycocaulis profundi]